MLRRWQCISLRRRLTAQVSLPEPSRLINVACVAAEPSSAASCERSPFIARFLYTLDTAPGPCGPVGRTTLRVTFSDFVSSTVGVAPGLNLPKEGRGCSGALCEPGDWGPHLDRCGLHRELHGTRAGYCSVGYDEY